MIRDLDGYYFRVKRDDEWLSICWSDLTENEMREILNDKDIKWVKSLCIGLGHTIKDIGDTLDIRSFDYINRKLHLTEGMKY